MALANSKWIYRAKLTGLSWMLAPLEVFQRNCSLASCQRCSSLQIWFGQCACDNKRDNARTFRNIHFQALLLPQHRYQHCCVLERLYQDFLGLGECFPYNSMEHRKASGKTTTKHNACQYLSCWWSTWFHLVCRKPSSVLFPASFNMDAWYASCGLGSQATAVKSETLGLSTHFYRFWTTCAFVWKPKDQSLTLPKPPSNFSKFLQFPSFLHFSKFPTAFQSFLALRLGDLEELLTRRRFEPSRVGQLRLRHLEKLLNKPMKTIEKYRENHLEKHRSVQLCNTLNHFGQEDIMKERWSDVWVVNEVDIMMHNIQMAVNMLWHVQNINMYWIPVHLIQNALNLRQGTTISFGLARKTRFSISLFVGFGPFTGLWRVPRDATSWSLRVFETCCSFSEVRLFVSEFKRGDMHVF